MLNILLCILAFHFVFVCINLHVFDVKYVFLRKVLFLINHNINNCHFTMDAGETVKVISKHKASQKVLVYALIQYCFVLYFTKAI